MAIGWRPEATVHISVHGTLSSADVMNGNDLEEVSAALRKRWADLRVEIYREECR